MNTEDAFAQILVRCQALGQSLSVLPTDRGELLALAETFDHPEAMDEYLGQLSILFTNLSERMKSLRYAMKVETHGRTEHASTGEHAADHARAGII